jgi:NhaP-type Na+/H+ or K+/H+ antiporter
MAQSIYGCSERGWLRGLNNQILAIVSIFAIAVVAMVKGIDGNIAYLAIGAIAGLAGYEVREQGRMKNSGEK